METAGNLIIGVSPRLQTWFAMQPWCLDGVIMIQIVSSDFISAAKEDGWHSAQQFCQFIETTSCKSSIWLSWTLTHPRWFSHSAHLSSRLLLDSRCCLRLIDGGHSCTKPRNFPSFFRHNWIQMMLNGRRQSCFLTVYLLLFTVVICIQWCLYFPSSPWRRRLPSVWSLPTFRPCQSNLSNLSKGQRPDRSSCIPIKLNTIEM